MGKKGFSILEVLVAMILLGLIVSGVFATFSVVGKGPGKMDLPELRGLIFARDTMERLKNNVSEDPARAGPLSPGAHADPTGNADFIRNYVVTDVDIDNNGTTDYKRVTVTVTWAD
jgi:prepilin-type N-terminal cleavage/methylation domain-containing protein